MQVDPHVKETPHGAGIGTYKSYSIGFILCLLLTLVAYFAVAADLFTGWPLIAALAGSAVLQIATQLILFVHLNAETKPRWNAIVFFFMILVAAIIVIGSIWIMANLNYRVMEPM